jgi:hypothetical protein
VWATTTDDGITGDIITGDVIIAARISTESQIEFAGSGTPRHAGAPNAEQA